MPKWLKVLLKVLAVLVILFVVAFIGISIYINTHKTKVLALVNEELNKNLDGNLTIGDMETSFFKGFPGISLTLKNVLVRDKRWAEHRHTLLQAQNFNVSVNTAALLRGTVRISRINISNAAIDLYKDSTGYSNTSILKKKHKKQKDEEGGGSSAEFGQIDLNNVTVAVNNQQKNKLFQFSVAELHSKMQYPDSGWHARIQLKVMPNNFAFNTDKGSFIKNKLVEGVLVAGYNEDKGSVAVTSNSLMIGEDKFTLNALFNVGHKPADFKLHLTTDELLWQNASALVANNISKTLNKFNLEKPLQEIRVDISGHFGGGNPKLHITGVINDNTLTTPGGTFNDCSFNAEYTNEVEKGKGFNDENSAINLYHFTGHYHQIPINIDTGTIYNLKKPIATGNFKSEFPLENLNELLGDDVAWFTQGNAKLNLHYKADVVDYQLNKPVISGLIQLNNANATYLPRNIKFRNTNITLGFIHNDLVLSDMRLQSGRSTVYMKGRVKNFLNLYYDAPEKILLTWHVRSPELHVSEFLGFLGKRKPSKVVHKKKGTGMLDQLGTALDKGNAEMHIAVNKLYYKKFVATDMHAELLTYEDGIIVKNMGLKHAGGSMHLAGRMVQGDNANRFAINTTISHVNIHEFFRAFNNFGMQSLTYKNLRGYLSAKSQISCMVNNKGDLVQRTMNGTLKVNLKDAALIEFEPLVKIGKFAFPFRDMKHIMMPSLNATFDIKGDKINIHPMQINSSVINADVAGTYALGTGTEIALDVPLRNPKKDEDITDKDELQKRRFKGIVLHILAKDDENGKLKIGWNKDHK